MRETTVLETLIRRYNQHATDTNYFYNLYINTNDKHMEQYFKNLYEQFEHKASAVREVIDDLGFTSGDFMNTKQALEIIENKRREKE